MWTEQQKALIVQEFIRTWHVIEAQRFVRTTMNRHPPADSTIRRWHQNFLSRGGVQQRPRSGRPRTSDANFNLVRQLYSTQPTTSIRDAERQLQIPRSTIQRILKKLLCLYPYKLQTLQALTTVDKQNRLRFAEHVLSQSCGATEYLRRIVFSDECIFRLNGHVNKQNVRIWAQERPSQVNEAPLHSPGVMVWCGISKTKIIGPFFFNDENVTGSSYKNMLSTYAFPRFQRLDDDYIFMQDGASPHFSLTVRNYLNRKRPNNWIGRGGPIPWPARSADLTPCDFFLWGHIKAKVYSTHTESIEHLKTKIRQEIRNISRSTLNKVWENAKFRLQYLPAVRGGHIETFIS